MNTLLPSSVTALGGSMYRLSAPPGGRRTIGINPAGTEYAWMPILPMASTLAEIQAVFDTEQGHGSGLVAGLASSVGGIIYLPAGVINMGTTPLYVGSGCTVKGMGLAATILNYFGPGKAIRFISFGTNGSHTDGCIEDLTIVSESDGIGINNPTYRGEGAEPPFNNEVSGITLRNVVLNCHGTPIDMDHPLLTYWLTLDNVLITGWGGVGLDQDGNVEIASLSVRAIKLGGTSGAVGVRLRRVKISNNTRAFVVGGSVVEGHPNTIVLDSAASTTDDIYNGMDVKVFSSGGVVQRRYITAYDGTTRTAQLADNWDTNPDNTYTYQIWWVQDISCVYVRGDGSIADCEFESDITTSFSVEMVDSRISWLAGHFETHTDETIARKSLYLDNTQLQWDFPQFAQPRIGFRLINNSLMSITGNVTPINDGGGVLDPADWGQVFQIEAGSFVYLRGQDITEIINGTGPAADLAVHIAATTVHGATSANTANRIVQRDSSGGFGAGDVVVNSLGVVDFVSITNGIDAAYFPSADASAFVVSSDGSVNIQARSGITLVGRIRTNATGIGVFGVTPIARAGATIDIKDALTNYGWLQGTSATDLNLDGGIITAVGSGLTSIPAAQLTGTIDLARLPTLPSTNTVVTASDIASLTAPEQAQIEAGTIVVTSDGRAWRYKGTGSKLLEASYVFMADVTPDWTTITNKPAFATVATSGLISDTTGTLTADRGGTGQSTFTTGDLLYASGSAAISKLADVAVGSVLKSGGVGVAPSWGTIASTDLSNTANIPLLNAAQTWSGVEKFTARCEFGPTSFTGSGVAYFYDATATTGSTLVTVRAGAGQSGDVMRWVRASDGSTAANSCVAIAVSGTQMRITSPHFATDAVGCFIQDGQYRLGSAGVVSWIHSSTNATAGTSAVLGINSANTLYMRGDSAAGVGMSMRWEGKSSTTSGRLIASDVNTWVVNTDTARTGRRVFNVSDGNGATENLREAIRIESNGTAGMFAVLGATAIPRYSATGDIRQLLIDFGFLTTGGATPLNLNGGLITSEGVSALWMETDGDVRSIAGNLLAPMGLAIVGGLSTFAYESAATRTIANREQALYYDCTAGSLSPVLPTSPIDGQIHNIIRTDSTVGNTLTLVGAVNNNGSIGSLVMSDVQAFISLQWLAESAYWRIRSRGQNSTARQRIDGYLNMQNTTTPATNPSASSDANIYVKGGKIIFQYNDAGTVRWKYLDMTGTGVTWTHTTSAP